MLCVDTNIEICNVQSVVHMNSIELRVIMLEL